MAEGIKLYVAGDYLSSQQCYILSEGIMYANENCYNTFFDLNNRDDLKLSLNNFNTSHVVNMSCMFESAQFKELDLSSFDTSNVTNMSSMFQAFYAEKFKIDSFNTSKVTNMAGMFAYAPIVLGQTLKNFITSNVKSMSNMFCGVSSTVIDISSFDTKNVTDMQGMFGENNFKLTTIYVGDGWDTTKVSSSGGMFYMCSSRLKGEAGTTWSSSNPGDKTYACVDRPDIGQPGYFTYKKARNILL